eukprot:GABV01010407.1.p2 GENE.GABV01010407.1~~GABV01010407.1.p2  ORF type:complete len:115 (-),score=30.10 GABV01010407.1:19-363(-)
MDEIFQRDGKVRADATLLETKRADWPEMEKMPVPPKDAKAEHLLDDVVHTQASDSHDPALHPRWIFQIRRSWPRPKNVHGWRVCWRRIAKTWPFITSSCVSCSVKDIWHRYRRW